MVNFTTTRAKRQLENAKLSLEIRELARPWWRKFSSYAALFPSILALIALIITLRTGYFDQERARFNAEKAELSFQIRVLNYTKDSLASHVAGLNDSIKGAKGSIGSLQMTLSQSRSTNQNLAKDIADKDSMLASFQKIMVEFSLWRDSVEYVTDLMGTFRRDQATSDEYRKVSMLMTRLLYRGPQLARELKVALTSKRRAP